MKLKNISKNSVINAVGRLVDPGIEVLMPVDYYAKNKAFVDNYVEKKQVEIAGIEEYREYVSLTMKNEESAPETIVTTLEAEEAKKANEAKEAEEAKKAEEAEKTKKAEEAKKVVKKATIKKA